MFVRSGISLYRGSLYQGFRNAGVRYIGGGFLVWVLVCVRYIGEFVIPGFVISGISLCRGSAPFCSLHSFTLTLAGLKNIVRNTAGNLLNRGTTVIKQGSNPRQISPNNLLISVLKFVLYIYIYFSPLTVSLSILTVLIHLRYH